MFVAVFDESPEERKSGRHLLFSYTSCTRREIIGFSFGSKNGEREREWEREKEKKEMSEMGKWENEETA